MIISYLLLPPLRTHPPTVILGSCADAHYLTHKKKLLGGVLRYILYLIFLHMLFEV